MLASRRIRRGVDAARGLGMAALWVRRLERSSDPTVRALGAALAGTRLPAEDRAEVDAIEGERARLLADPSPLVPSGAPVLYDSGKSVRDACLASTSPERAQILFRLVRALEPAMVVEIGTNVGIGAAYIAAGLRRNRRGRLTTLDGSPHRSSVARDVHGRLQLANVDYVVGLFDEVLPETLERAQPVDLAFVDGNHAYEPTLRYFDWLFEKAADPAVIVFDDIRWRPRTDRIGKKTSDAWNDLRRNPAVHASIDIGDMGICAVSRSPRRPLHTPSLLLRPRF